MWQTFVRNWVVGKLHERLGEHARAANANPPPPQGDAPSPPHAPAQPVVCHVGVIVGQRAEAAGLIDRMTGVVETLGEGFVAHEGSVAGRRVVIITAGQARPRPGKELWHCGPGTGRSGSSPRDLPRPWFPNCKSVIS